MIDLTDAFLWVMNRDGYLVPVFWPLCREPGCTNRRFSRDYRIIPERAYEYYSTPKLEDHCFLHGAEVTHVK